MTNAEKLAKDTEKMADIIGAMCSAFHDCEGVSDVKYQIEANIRHVFGGELSR